MSFLRIISLQFLIILNAFVLLETLQSWGNRQLFPHYQIPEGALDPKRTVVRRKIVLYHNFFRTKVRPTASNMLLMSWHPGAAQQAQRYAEQCRFLEHNNQSENTVPHLGACGQNLFVAAQKTPWFFGIKSWFIEYKNFTYGNPNQDIKAVGHYTQLVWATSHRVGCGLARCSGGPWGHFYNYVCHYCPAGNLATSLQYPYKKGKRCADCPNHCISASICNNPCMKRDLFSNCDELVSSSRGVCAYQYCNATCQCGNARIHKNYPW